MSGTLYTLLLVFPTFKVNVIYAHFTEKIGGLESLRNLLVRGNVGVETKACSFDIWL